VSQFGDLWCPERLDVAILLLADFHGCISLTLTCLSLFTRVLIIDDRSCFLRWAWLYIVPGTVNPRLLLFALCARYHTRVRSPWFHRSTFRTLRTSCTVSPLFSDDEWSDRSFWHREMVFKSWLPVSSTSVFKYQQFGFWTVETGVYMMIKRPAIASWIPGSRCFRRPFSSPGLCVACFVDSGFGLTI